MLDLATNMPTWIKDSDFQYGALVAMQNSVDADGNVTVVDASECITSFDTFWTAKDSIDL